MLAGLALVVTSAAGSQPAAQGRCCFAFSVDAFESMALNYKGTAPGHFIGSYDVLWHWQTRAIVSYTGGGLDVAPYRLAQGGITELSAVSVLRPPPAQPQPQTCAQPANIPYYSDLKPTTGAIAEAKRNVAGFARALVVTDPVGSTLGTKCATAIEGPASHGLQGPDQFTVQAPSVNNFLNGTAFRKVCTQSVELDHNSPFLHHFSGFAVYEVRFTYFPKSDLTARNKTLHGLAGKTRPDPQGMKDAASDHSDQLLGGTLNADGKPHCK